MDWWKRKKGREGEIIDIRRKNYYDLRIESKKSECNAQTPHDLLTANLKHFLVECKHSCETKKINKEKRREKWRLTGCRSKHEKVVTSIIHGSPIKSKNDQTHE